MSDVEELLSKSPKKIMRSIIQRIATGPNMSKDISREEARAGIRAVLNDDVDPIQAAIFLIALRMKRETDDENIGVLEGIREVSHLVTAPVDEVFDLSDPYNGYNRTLPAAPFLPALLSACGVNTVSHGVKTMSPKFGITHHLVLKAAGIDVNLSVEEAASRLGETHIGWAYIDQASYCPVLHKLTDLRSNIVKRPLITTVEVLTNPIRGKLKNHFMSGYVHRPYTRIYAMLARHVGFDSCLLIRGVEGGIIPSLRQKGRMFYYHNKDEEQSKEFSPEEIDIQQDVRATLLPDDLPQREDTDDVGAAFDVKTAAQLSADNGIAALSGSRGTTYDGLVYAGAIALWHLKKADSLQSSAKKVREVLDSGLALEHFNAAKA